MKFSFLNKQEWLRKYVYIGLVTLGGVVLFGLILALILQSDLPSPAQLNNIQPRLITRVFDRNGELFKEHWTTEEARDAFGDKSSKYYTGVHGDRVYSSVFGLSK